MSEPATETIVPTESFEAYFTRANVAEREGTLSTLAEPEPPPVVVPEPVEPEVPPVEAAAEPVVAKKPRNDPQARIDQAIGKQREAERVAKAAVDRAAQLERDLAAREQPKPAAAPVAVATPAFPDFGTWAARPGNEAKPYEDYIDARTDFRYEQRQQRDQQTESTRRAIEHIDTTSAAFTAKLKAEVEQDPEFATSVDPLLIDAHRSGAYGTCYTQNSKGEWSDRRTGEVVPPPSFASFLMEQVYQSDQPKALLLHLSRLPYDERQRLATLPPDQVIRALAKIEASVPVAAVRGPAQVPPVISQAPEPITPLGSSPVVRDDTDEADLPLEQFIKRGNARDRKAGRRL